MILNRVSAGPSSVWYAWASMGMEKNPFGEGRKELVGKERVSLKRKGGKGKVSHGGKVSNGLTREKRGAASWYGSP